MLRWDPIDFLFVVEDDVECSVVGKQNTRHPLNDYISVGWAGNVKYCLNYSVFILTSAYSISR